MMQRRASRRRFLSRAVASAAGLVVAGSLAPRRVAAESLSIDPYAGSIPLVFPLAAGMYQTPVADNWHAAREGSFSPWNHRDADGLRAHDGVDVYPLDGAPLPPVSAPFAGSIAAVCTRSDNTLAAEVSYRVSSVTPPPWDYHEAVDDAAGLPLYGNFVWLVSADPRSAGFFVLICHLQNDALIRTLTPDRPVDAGTPLGTVGDTGNAAGTPQLHVEIHLPAGSSFACRQCAPGTGMTSINAAASLQRAAAAV